MSFSVIFEFLVSFVLLMVCVTVHEFAHGWVAFKRGDNTARYMGRLTLNPLAHIDPVMTLLFPFLLFVSTNGRFVFGAAKPVPVDFSALKNPRRDMVLVGLAGPAANFVFAFVLSMLLRVVPPADPGRLLVVNLVTINVVLGVFNLIPIPPLDGSRVVMGLLPPQLADRYALLDRFGFIILIALLWLNVLDIFLWPTVNLILHLFLPR
ncbi:MAG: site-2 protease family protein [Candidatus Omnitrophica bacterium]|nr:site-2 protease family protein [Candidatus Omnitrophota bacterium]